MPKWTQEEYDEMYRKVDEAFEAAKPKPKPTPTEKAQDRWATPPDEAILQQAAKSAEAQLEMVERWRDRRQERLAKEYAEWNEQNNDPRVKYQRELDAWWQRQRDLADALDDGYVEIGGFRERRKGAQFHKAKGDADYGL